MIRLVSRNEHRAEDELNDFYDFMYRPEHRDLRFWQGLLAYVRQKNPNVSCIVFSEEHNYVRNKEGIIDTFYLEAGDYGVR